MKYLKLFENFVTEDRKSELCYQDSEVYWLNEKEFSKESREKMAKKGEALPDGSFPIRSLQDLKNAIKAHGRAKNPAEVKKHILKRAKELKHTDLIPDTWKK